MKEYLKQAGVIAVAVFIGVFAGAKLSATANPNLAGDFPGGVVPSQLITGTTAGGLTGNGYVYPVGSLSSDAANGLSVGGSNQYHGFTSYNTASGTPAAVITLGPLGATTSTATTTVTLQDTIGLSLGAICSGGAGTTTVYVSGCLLASTDGATGTALVAYSNITNAALSVPTTTVLRITFDQLPY